MGNDAGRKSLYGVNSIGGDLDSAQSKKPKKNRKFGRILKKPILCKLVYIRQPKRLLFRHFCTKRFSNIGGIGCTIQTVLWSIIKGHRWIGMSDLPPARLS